ncbi:tyrosine-type recombinase/integrase [Neobacillus sp. YX16]|uniref:tyrosine-type recombinase/integrase n=1 Tax=Neobacillus sp. YX16 TaxID=3047874 RepID=UPI0024C2E38F|nr:tyrosine-type recombinase/integrase [Neobacillus sp. YX16]WHZ01178.1 tyrosine-type recombinase/integrase [Neobacillus sp. YX16]
MSRRGLLTEEELQIVRKQLTDEEAIAKFERDCQLKNLRPSTIEFYKNEFKAVKSSLVEMEIRKEVVELKKKDIEQLILHLKDKIKIVSINTRIRALSAFFNYLYRIRAVTPNPMKNIQQLRDRQRVIETLEDDEILRLTKYMKKQRSFIGERDLTIFLVMLDTGIRLAETVGIKVEDVRKNKLFIRNTKNLTERIVYPSKKVQAILENYLKLRGDLSHEQLFINRDNKPLRPRSIQTRFEKYKDEVGIEKQFSPHILRHTYAKRSILAGMDAFSLAALLGHSDLSVTKKYVALWGNDLEEKAKKYSSIDKLDI